jgi:hypothetical protein
MFIQAPAKKEKLVSYTFSVPESAAEQFDLYLEFAMAQWERNQKPSPREVLPLILESALRADKGFAKWLKVREAGAPLIHAAERYANPESD